MMKTTALFAAAALLIAAPAFAQTAAPDTAQPGTPGHHMNHGDHAGRRGEGRERFAAMRQQRLADMKTVLRLRPDQDAAFQAYIAASMPEHKMDGRRMGDAGKDGDHMHAGPAAMTGPALTTPQEMDRMAQWKAKREQHMAQREEATKRFYAALSPEQQQVFDALRRLSHGRGGRGHSGWGRGGRMGMERG